MSFVFKNRKEAGRQLARELSPFARPDAIVLALPRGGVPVAFEVALDLGVPLDVFVVRKLGAPFQPELAIGAIAAGGVTIYNDELIEQLGISPQEIGQLADAEHRELERRERSYRESTPPADLQDKLVILVDDGLATGYTMKAAIEAVRRLGAARVVVAVPVSPSPTCQEIQHLADDLVCLYTPENFRSVGEWYSDFGQVSDAEVQQLLTKSRDLAAVGGVVASRRRCDVVGDGSESDCAWLPPTSHGIGVGHRHTTEPGRGARDTRKS